MDKCAVLLNAQIIETSGGEAAKSLQSAEKIWNELLTAGAARSSLLINLGGGVVSDLGGFVAAGYMRGINYINIPTSLIGQADAAIGGKTAVNIGHLKNQIGFFHAPKAVFIFTGFLNTLPREHFRSGIAEIIKSTLISSAASWGRLQKNPVSRILNIPVESKFWQVLIMAAVTYKNKVVVKDNRERKLRKVLNFGHTIGHALEGYSQMGPGTPLLHGEAVAAGMICAAYLSHRKTRLSQANMLAITNYIHEGFGFFPVEPSSKPTLMEIMMHDKKVYGGNLHFTLISKPGFPVINVACNYMEISGAIDYYCSLSK